MIGNGTTIMVGLAGIALGFLIGFLYAIGKKMKILEAAINLAETFRPKE